MKMSQYFLLKNNNGFSLAESLAAIAISGIISVGIAHVYSESAKNQKINNTRYWMNVRRTQVKNLIRSPNSLPAIVAQNPAMNCLLSNTSCATHQAPQALKLMIDGVLMDGTLPGLGMKSDGDFCNDYGATQSNCTLGISLTWQIVCDSANCKAGQLRVDMQFQHETINGNPAKLVVYRSSQTQDMSDACADFGGNLVGNNCILPQLNTSCNTAAGSYPLGYDNTGKLICGNPNVGSCSGSDSIVGFNASGGLICGSACL